MHPLRAALAFAAVLAALSPATSRAPLAALSRASRASRASQPVQPPRPAPPGASAPPPEEVPPLRPWTRWRSDTEPPLARIAEANAAKLAVVKTLFADAKVSFPPAQLLLRAFKKEQRLEMWGASRAGDKLVHVATYGICAASGKLGPKRRQGDFQVPEGFYTLTEYSPTTGFYLAMLVSYPNLSDRILGDPIDPGNEIMVHGRCVSIGCLSMSDERIQEIWIAATALRYAGGVVHVHIFPSRDMAGLLAAGEQPEHRAFWENLKEGFDYFESRRRLPSVRVAEDGKYRFY